MAVVDEFGIDFVRNDKQIVPGDDFGDFFQVFFFIFNPPYSVFCLFYHVSGASATSASDSRVCCSRAVNVI